ncbi:MAG TPA: glycosyl hydrolase [Thermoanaerobaculia bacterium]|nr:glycosyl hydrolase [Thermoanaerobaculia bacterium]
MPSRLRFPCHCFGRRPLDRLDRLDRSRRPAAFLPALPALQVLLALAPLLLASPAPAAAAADQAKAAKAAKTGQSQAAARNAWGLDPERWKALRWREVGPYRGGRSAAVAGVASDRATYYFGGAGGGVWKSTDAGRSWRNVSDGTFGGSIGAVAVAALDPNVIYAGTGEETVRGNVSEGDGMWKSTDAGKTWKRAGLPDSRHITRIRIHPRNPDLVYAAVLGHLFGPNPQRGVFRSQDGGASWQRVLHVDDSVGAVDLAMDPANPRVLYASMWRVRRTPYSLESGGPGSGLWKSTDGGDTWTDLSHGPGMPKGTLGIIGVTVSPTDSENVYAIVEADGGGVFRSRDGGKTWQKTSSEHELTQRAWYYNRIFADPADAESVYVVNVFFLHSKDGGKTFSSIKVPHGDNHDLWIDPADPRRMIESNDGGANVSEDGGRTWTPQDNQPTAQIYRVTTDNHFPYRIYGAQQDNSALRIASRGEGQGIGRRDWEPTAGGESGYILADPRNPDVVYGGSYGGFLVRQNHATGEVRDVNPWPDNPMGAGAAGLEYRFQWNFPIAISPHDPRVLYVGSNVLFKSGDEGQSWTAISPDLTRNDKSRQGPSGGPITKDNTSVEYYDTIFTVAESPLTAGVLWVGSDDGLVHVSRDAGAHWQDVTPAGLPAWSQINSIEASPFDAGAAYFAATLYKADDYHPYLYKTADYGRHWTRIDDGIDRSHFTRVVRADPVRRGLLFAGTQGGAYVSFDDGGRWQPLQLNLPLVPVTDLTIKEGDLVAATEGRGFWVLDDLEPLRELAADPKLTAAPIHLFTPRPTFHVDGYGEAQVRPGTGQNPPGGVVVDYYLRDAPAAGQAPLVIEILDRDGKLIHAYTAAKPAAKAAPEKPASGPVQAGGATAPASAPGAPASATPAAAPAKAAPEGAAAAAAAVVEPEGPGERESESEAEAEAGGEGEKPALADELEAPKEPKPPAAQGFNRFVWDMTYRRAKGFPGMVLWARDLIAPQAVPGSYQVRLKVGGQSATVPFTIVKDPRSSATPADLEAQLQFLLGIRDKLDSTHDALRRIRVVRAQIADLGKRLRAAAPDAGGAGGDAGGGVSGAGGSGGAPTPPAADPNAPVRKAAKELDGKLAAIEETLYQTKSRSVEDALNYPIRLDDKLNGVAVEASIGFNRPTAQAIAVRDRLVAAIDVQLAKLDDLLAHDLPSFNQVASGAGVQAVIPPRPRLK